MQQIAPWSQPARPLSDELLPIVASDLRRLPKIQTTSAWCDRAGPTLHTGMEHCMD